MDSRFNFFGQTDRGKIKEFNEDVFLGFVHKNVLFIMVADAMGGRDGLDIASAVAVNEMRRHIEYDLENDSPEHLKGLIAKGMYFVNRILLTYRRAADAYAGMATTLTVCAINSKKDIVVGHAGNTRMYLLRGGELTQLTKDHTETQSLLDQKKISKDEARIHPERATLTKALGAWESIECDVFGGKVIAEDILFLCSDGVYNLLLEQEIGSVILEAGESEKACNWLINGANTRGGTDNIVALLSYIAP